MKKFILFASIMIIVSIGNTSLAQVSKGPRTTVVGTMVNKSRGASQYTLPTKDVALPKPDKRTAGTCCIIFNNLTGDTVYIWVDGVFKGTVMAGQDSEICVQSSLKKWYARTAGDTFEWSGKGNCQAHYSLKLK